MNLQTITTRPIPMPITLLAQKRFGNPDGRRLKLDQGGVHVQWLVIPMDWAFPHCLSVSPMASTGFPQPLPPTP